MAGDASAAVARRYKLVGPPTDDYLGKRGDAQHFGNELPKDFAARPDAMHAKA